MAESKTLGEAILVPQVYTDLNTRYILVTEWVEGVKVRRRNPQTRHNIRTYDTTAERTHQILGSFCSPVVG